MIANLAEIDPKRVAAILYRPEQDADRLLADLTQDLARQGVRVGGIVQRTFKGANGTKNHASTRRCNGARDSDPSAARQRRHVLQTRC
ncbi:DUF2478 domain-containing protein [Bradyrhizobium sp. LMTR 3]|uniref:DUF2478 domain-containing protein n=1 Tax=Bradyrhizobium sp. LMTR 3 TaxID=189873 RepID=UPI000AC56364